MGIVKLISQSNFLKSICTFGKDHTLDPLPSIKALNQSFAREIINNRREGINLLYIIRGNDVNVRNFSRDQVNKKKCI